MDTALVDNEVRRETLGLEMGCKRRGVVRFVPRVAPLGVVLTDDSVEGVVVGHIGNEAADLLAGAGQLDHRSKLLGGQGQVPVPAEPAAVGSIDVQVDMVVL